MNATDLVPQASTTAIDRGLRGVDDVTARVRRIQEVMKALMKPNVHFGVIPGTDKPTLYKPGAELLLTTFRIAATVGRIDDLSTADEIRYRVSVRGVNQVGSDVLGEMVGECSSSEEKYRWRRPVCDEEFDDTPEDRRREKWARARAGAYKQKQVRTSPSDVANTVLKMAVKRALIAMTLVVTSASDIFAQDLEDLPEEIRESIGGEEGAQTAPPVVTPPKRKSEAAAPAAVAPADGALRVVKVDAKPGTSKSGKAYVKYTITDSKGATYGTFTESLAKLAIECRDHQVPVEFVYDTGQYGNDLTELRKLAVSHAE